MTSFHPIDVHVGLRMKQRRLLLGMSQGDIAKSVGLSFQQVQKYEKGRNRLSASKLFEFADVLGVPVSHFFDALSPKTSSRKQKPAQLKAKAVGSDAAGLFMKRETLEFVRAYYKIEDATQRKRLTSLLTALGRR